MTHNKSLSPEFRTWAAMKTRCTNPNQRQWKDYGGRGITLCERWLNSFENFYEDVGSKPGPKFSIDRIKNDKGYEPGNVRWATKEEQWQNKRTSHFMTFNGKTQCLAEWAKETGLGSALMQRILRGWTVEEALSIPLRGKRPVRGD